MESERADVPGLVSHLRDALTRDGLVAEVIASLTEKVETIPELPPIEDPLKDVVVDVVENQKFLMEYLLSESRETLDLKLPLENDIHHILDLLRPLYILEKQEPTLEMLKEAHSNLSLVIDKLIEKAGRDDRHTKETEYINERLGVAIWCLENLKLGPKWSAEAVFKLSKDVPCNFTLLEQLGAIKILEEEKAATIFASQPKALDFYKHSLAISKFLAFLYKEFRERDESIYDIDRLLSEIMSAKLRLRTLGEIYDSCFLRKEDLKAEDTKSRDSDVTAYLCRDAKKLKLALQMLKRQLETVYADGDSALAHRQLEPHVNQALWRLELVECDPMAGWYTRHLLPNSTSRSWTNAEWLERLDDPAALSLFGYSHTRRKTRLDPDEDPLIVNRLVADPRSLVILAAFNSRFTGAGQVADFYQLWDTDEGRQLRVALTFGTAANELLRLGKELCSSCDSDDVKKIRLASAVETQLSLLQQTAELPEASVFAADLALAVHDSLAPNVAAYLLDFALQRLSDDVDFKIEPWKTFRDYVECFNFQLQQPNPFESPLHSNLPLNLDERKAFLDQKRKRRSLLDKAIAAFKGDPESVGLSLQALHDGVRPLKPVISSPLIRMKHFFEILRKILPERLKNESIERLMDKDIGEMIFERIREAPESFQELETNTKLLGIDLPWFLGARLCYPEESLISIVKADLNFIAKILEYLNTKNNRLAEIVELVLQRSYEVPLATLYGLSKQFQEGASIYRRYLEYRAKPKFPEAFDEVCETVASPSPPASPIEELNQDEPIDEIFQELAQEPEVDPLAETIVALSEVIPEDKKDQLNDLLPEPLLAIEQLFMNSQISLASDLVKVMRSRGSVEDNEAIDRLALQYATKALALGLPDIPSTPSDNKTQKKAGASFVMPSTAPTKDQWIPDADVNQCPCCKTVNFSMFDRRHHCRRCGRVVCAHCSPHRHLVDGYGDVPVRTCSDCHSALEERKETPDLTAVRSPSENGVSWTLSLDEKHNEIARREFSYEDAPNLALTLSLVHCCQSSEMIANFLLEQSSNTLATLHRYLMHGKLLEVCSDPNIIFSIVKSLIVSAKMRYSEIIASPEQQGLSKAKPSRGLARCDALLDQIDLLSLLSTSNCLNLLPPQPLSQKDTWRKLRDRLIEVELWSLALDVSTKAGLDSETVWATWGLVFLRAGNFKGARQRFQRCMKPGKPSPLLQEIVQVLERIAVPVPCPREKRARRVSTSSSPPSLLETDAPQLIAARLARLNDIAAGRYPEMEDKHFLLPETLYYLDTYGLPEASYAHLVEKSQRIDLAVNRFASGERSPDVFNHGLLMPCLTAGKLEDLFVEMRRHDASFQTWKKYLLAAAQLLESKGYWNCLYQLHCLSSDWIRASLVAIRRLYLSDLCSIETLITRSHLLEDVLGHLGTYLGRQSSCAAPESEGESQLPLWWPANEVTNLQKTIRHQLKVTNFLDACSKVGKVTASLLKEVKTVTQAPEADSSNHYLVPTLLGSRHFRHSCAVLITCAGHDTVAFELSWQICADFRVRLDRYFRQSSFVLIRLGLIQPLIGLVEFVKTRMTEQSPGYFDMDELLVECATLIQERDKESKSPDTELILQLIKKSACKIRALINVGWLKAAYLLAVKSGQVADVIHIKQEAIRLQQPTVLALCEKWLRARNVK